MATQPIPEQWFTDYSTGGFYTDMSLTDYIAFRRSGMVTERHEISLKFAH